MGDTGERDAPSGALKPMLAEEEHGFATIPVGSGWPSGLVPVATFAEPEGASVIALAELLKGIDIDHQAGWAKITIGADTSLRDVGVSARIASALAEKGISANIVAAYHHDHVFVPWDRREEAMSVLNNLSDPRE